jgi:hypothetical protein
MRLGRVSACPKVFGRIGVCIRLCHRPQWNLKERIGLVWGMVDADVFGPVEVRNQMAPVALRPDICAYFFPPETNWNACQNISSCIRYPQTRVALSYPLSVLVPATHPLPFSGVDFDVSRSQSRPKDSS